MGQLQAEVRAFLDYLGVAPRAPNLDLLNDLVREHQRKVPFETLTKLIDYERGWRQQDFLPDIGHYVERVTTAGGGGLCWTLARGFHWLLAQLGFDVHFMIMQPGHVCLRAELDRPYYVDVGYAVPVFRAYPLDESFSVQDARCKFSYEVTADGIVTTQQPGPVKRLDATPRSFDEFDAQVIAANHWTADSFLTKLSVFGYVDGVPTSLANGKLKRFLGPGPEQRYLSEEQTLFWIEQRFGMDPQLYLQAREIYAKWMQHHDLPIDQAPQT